MNYHFFNIQHLVKQLSIAGFFIVLSVPVFAKTINQPLKAVTQAQPNLQVLNSNENSTLLSLQFNTEIPVKFEVVIRDENRDLLYRKQYETSNFSKQFQLKDLDASASVLYLSVVLADGKEYNYTVSNTIETVREIAVIKK
ncbi:MAG: hypothetical protein V4717_12665 [Bacteroidota bacterium]